MTHNTRIVSFGQYDLELKLAHGGMAEVFLGKDRQMGPDAPKLVIKRILPELGHDSRFVAMFINEAQLAAQMDHDNIVKVINFGEVDGRLYMVMEHVDGLDCWRFSRRLHPWGDNHVALAVHIIQKVLAALTYAHGLKDVNEKPLHVVHRDLSPSNIYLSLKGDVKLGDFGIARIESTRYRPIGVIPKGKFGYMAPEQVEGLDVDQRADVYSAGVVLAELIIGQKLFSGKSRLSVMLDIRDGRIDILEKNAEMIPASLFNILRGALAIKPSDRFRNAAEFNEALEVYLETTGQTSTREQLAAQLRPALDARDTRSSLPAVNTTSPPPAAEDDTSVHAVKGIAEHRAGVASEPDEIGTPITVENDHLAGEGHYMARIDDSTTIGPTSYAHIIELICSDRITGDTLISLNNREYVSAREIPELIRHLPVYTPTCDIDEINTPDRRGLIDVEMPAEVLLSLAVNNESGLLICQQEERRKEMYFKNGHPVYVGSNDPHELLGEFLVKNGVIDRLELEMALALLPKFSGHLGDTLIALGMLSAVDLFSHITAQVNFRFSDLLDWNMGNYEFYRGVDCRSGVLEIRIDPFIFIRDRMLERMQEIDETILVEMRGTLIAPTSLLPRLIDKMNLPSEIDEKIRSLGDWISVADLCEAAGGVNILIARALFVALETGLWTFDGENLPWR